MIDLTTGYSKTLASKGIRANTISPSNIYFEGSDWHKAEQNAPEDFEEYVSMNSMARMGRGTEVAHAIVYLASPRASFMSGANVVVDGGLTSQLMI